MFIEKINSFYIETYNDQSKILKSLTIPFEIGQRNLNDIRFRNVTKIQFENWYSRSIGMY